MDAVESVTTAVRGIAGAAYARQSYAVGRGKLEERYKRQLEGLLQARSEDMRHGRGPRRVQSAQKIVLERPLSPAGRSYGSTSGRLCDDCGDEIGARRLRAMPRATLCVACQRTSEQAATAS